MDYIFIKKNGTILLRSDLEDEKEDVVLKSVTHHLGREVEFEDGITFGTLIKIIKDEHNFFEEVFNSETEGKSIKQLFSKIDNENNKEIKNDKDIYLEITKLFELINYEEKNINTINLFPILVGVDYSSGEKQYIQTNLIPHKILKNCNIYINNEIELFKNTDQLPSDKKRNVLSAYVSITLYEVIRAVVYEMFFFDEPDENLLIVNDDKQKQVQDSERQIHALQNKMEKCVEDEDYEEASKINKQIKKIKEKTKNIKREIKKNSKKQ